MKLIKKYLLISICCMPTVCLLAQTEMVAVQDTVKKTNIYMIRTDMLSFDEGLRPDVKLLTGNVIFRHDSSYMYCDSAYFSELTNSLEAFSNVRMEQGDTLFVYSDYLKYDGNTRIAYLRDNVRMVNNQVTLYTDSLNYDRWANLGYYFDNGYIVDEENKLLSVYGQYSPDTKLAIFHKEVKLENPQFTLYSDTLHYSTSTKIATILGPSTIVSDSGTVHTSRGWYNTETNNALLLDRSDVVSGNRILSGDSISYDRKLGFGEAFGNMMLQDTARHTILEGDYGFYDEIKEHAFATGRARMMEYSQGDTLYLHADTLEMFALDTAYREVKAYYGVRFYRTDIQGVCDRMYFNTRDSVLYMIDEPVLWNQEYQLYGDTILIFMGDSSVDYVHIKNFAFAVQELDTSYYNQIKGNDLKAYFEGQQVVRQIDVEGNAESIFYPIEDNGAMVGLNETKSGFLSIWLKEGELEKLKIWPNPKGTLTPIPDLHPEQKTLKDFHWFDYMRPANKEDIYQTIKRKTEDVPRRNSRFVH